MLIVDYYTIISYKKLYEKHVPQATREYIDDKLSREAAAKPKRPVRPAAAGGSDNRLT